MGNFLLSIIIPIYNEEEVLKNTYNNLYKEIIRYNYEIIFINDGSIDNTINIIKEICKENSNCKLINFSRNFGQQKAISAGLKYSKGDCIIIMDSDGQDPFNMIHEMIKYWKDGYKIVSAQRKKRIGENLFKKISAKIFYKIINSLSNINLPENVGDFRLIDRKVCNYFNNFKEKDKYIRGIISYEGFSQKFVLYDRPNRTLGKTKYNLKKMLKLAMDGIYSFSYKPLYFELFVNFIFFIISIIYFLYLLITLKIKDISNRHFLYLLSLISFSSFIKSLNNKYIENIHENMLNRPEYIIQDLINI